MDKNLTTDFQVIFNSMPGFFLILQPDAPHFTILAMSDELLEITDSKREDVVGKSVFEVYSENPKAITATGASDLRISLQNVMEHKKTNYMPIVRYDVPNADRILEERYWSSFSKPVLDDNGEVTCIIHTTTDVTEKVKAENAQHTLKKFELTQNVFLKAPIAMCIVNGPENIIEVANEPMLRLLNSKKEILRKPLLETVPELKDQGFIYEMDQVRKTNAPYNTTEHPVTLDRDGQKTHRYYNIAYQPYNDNPAARMASGVFIMAFDVTEHVNAKKLLEDKKQYLQNAIDIADLGTFKIDVASNTGSYSKNIGNWFGLEGLRQPMDTIILKVHPDDVTKVTSALKESLQTTDKSGHDITYRVLPDSSKDSLYLRSIGKALFYNGKPDAIIGIIQDVTPQMKAQQSIAESEQQIRSLIESAPFPIAVYIGKEKRIQFANQPMIDAYGKGNDVVGKLFSEVLPELDPRIHEQMDKVYKTGIPFHARNKGVDLMINGKMQTFYYTYSFTPLFDRSGKVYGIMTTAADVTDLILAQQKIQESESRFRHMVQQAPVAITLTRGRNFVIENMNTPMLHIIGKRHEEEVIGKSLLEVLPEIEDQEALKIMLHVLETGKPYIGNEVAVRFGVGEQIEVKYFNISYTPVVEKEKIKGILQVAIDVTEQVVARKKIEEGAKELMNLANAMPQVVWIAEANGDVTYFNNRVSEFAGARKLPDETWHWESIVIPEDLQATVEAWNTAVSAGTVYEQEHRIHMKDGTRRWFLSRAYPQRDETGVVVKWYGTATDVQEQKANEEALRTSEEQLRIAVEAADLGTFSFYPETKRIDWPAKTKELFGISHELEINEENFFKTIYPDDKERFYATIQKAMQPESGGVYENEFRILSLMDNQIRWMRSKGKVSFNAEGKAIRLTGVTQDVTGQKQSAEALKQKNMQLIHINNDLDNFIYTASHDLKAPISNIEGLLSLLADGYHTGKALDEEAQQIVRMMQESVNRFKKTIASLTDVVKLQQENGGGDVLVDLQEIIREVSLDLSPMINAYNVELETDLSGCGSIRFSEKNLRSVIYNLLSNAIKYRSPERAAQVRIRCESTSNHHILTVEDNGLGMRQGSQGQLFTMFKRFHDHVEGTGIGLYMVKKIVDNAGGHIEVESQIDVGTIFKVYFTL